MAATVYERGLAIEYFTVQGSSLERLNILNYTTRIFAPNPVQISLLGGTKTSTLTVNQVTTNFQYDFSSTITLANDNQYRTSNWLFNGWTANVRATFLQELKVWIGNNLDRQPINPFPATAGFVIELAEGQIGSFAYSIPLIIYGNFGTVV